MFDEPDLRLLGLSMWVRGRERPDSDDPDDSNWLDVRVRMEAPSAMVECQGPILMTSDVAFFAEELKSLTAKLTGEAKLESLEPGLMISMKMKQLGQIEATVDVTPDYMTQSHRFMLSLDQTFLPPVIASCEAILERFPVVRGK